MFSRSKILYQQTKNNTFIKYVPPSKKAALQHLEYAKEKRKNDLLGKIVHYGFFTLIGGSVLMYLWQPWNPYSNEVSKELRKGLWEERDGKEDYLNALKYYQNAIEIAKNDEKMDQLSLNYTGMILKIAEMYQNLNMTDYLIQTYFNLSTFIFENLIHGNISKDNQERELLIDRDLIVITRWSMLMQNTKPKNWFVEVNNELQDRIAFIENNEIGNDLPWLATNSTIKPINTEELIDIWFETTLDTFDINHIKRTEWINENIDSDNGKEFLKCWDLLRYFNDKTWPVWIESYLKLRDYYAMLQMSCGNLVTCIQILQSNLLWSAVAGFKNTVNGTTQIHNLASAWFKLGQLKNDKNAYLNSRMIYEKLISEAQKNDPILPISYYSLGVLALELGNETLAEENFEKARHLAIEMDQLKIIEKIDEEQLNKLKK